MYYFSEMKALVEKLGTFATTAEIDCIENAVIASIKSIDDAYQAVIEARGPQAEVPVSRKGDLTIQYEWSDKQGSKMQIEIFWNTDFSDHEVCVRFVDSGYTTIDDGKPFKKRREAEAYAQDLFNKYNPKVAEVATVPETRRTLKTITENLNLNNEPLAEEQREQTEVEKQGIILYRIVTRDGKKRKEYLLPNTIQRTRLVPDSIMIPQKVTMAAMSREIAAREQLQAEFDIAEIIAAVGKTEKSLAAWVMTGPSAKQG